MLKVFYSEDKNSLNYELHHLIQKLGSGFSKIEFSNNHQQILEQVNTQDLFGNNNTYIIEHADFVSQSNKKDVDLLNKLKESECEIYLFTNKKANDVDGVNIHKIDKFTPAKKTKFINELLSKNKVVFENERTKNKFESLLRNDQFLIENEIQKLSLYNAPITEEIITKEINDSNELNVFKLTSLMLVGQKVELIKLYEELISSKFQPTEIVQIMASQLFQMKLLKLALLNRYSTNSIASDLKIPSFVVYKEMNTLNRLSMDKINQIISDFTLLDYNLKHGLINPYQGLKLILVK